MYKSQNMICNKKMEEKEGDFLARVVVGREMVEDSRRIFH